MKVAATAQHAEAAARLRVVVTRLNRQLRSSSPGGLTLSQWSALVTIEAYQPMRIGDLAERERFSAPTATRLTAALEEAGLVTRSSDPTDRRTSYIALTDAGLEKLDSARTMREASLTRRLSSLPDADVSQLLELLPVLESLLAVE
jgi:DNA-binding MarR family transcriptional regulator